MTTHETTMPRQRLLLTGSEGMLGRYLRQAFVDYDITVLNRRAAPGGIRCDLSREVPELPGRYDLVVHAAGTRDEERAMAVNLKGTRHLLEALEKYPPAHIIYISDAAVYGLSEAEDIDETAHTWTTDKVGQSKILAEGELSEWAAKHAVAVTTLRPATMFGDGISGEMARLFADVITGRYVHIRGNEARRGVVTAYDVARAAYALREQEGTFNVADGRNRPWLDLIHAMQDNAGTSKRPAVLPAKWAAVIGVLPGMKRYLDPERLKRYATTLTYRADRLREATGLELHDTIEVIARRDTTYPYASQTDTPDSLIS